MMRPTESDIIYSQQIGRGLRIDEHKTKWLNVIDMVFNSQKDNDVMLNGLYDSKLTPTEKANIISDWINGNNSMLPQIEREAASNIISRILRESYKTSYRDSIERKSIEKKGHLSILEMYNEINTENNFQSLVYSFKKNKKINSNSIPWIISSKSIYEDIKSTKIEWPLIEAMTWMPLTASSSKEKELIFQLLSTGKVEISNTKNINGLNSKWVNYFTGESLQTGKQSQMIIYNGFKWFQYSKNILRFNFNSLNKFTEEIRREVLEYLIHNKNKSDYLVEGRTYSKSEISFMFGHTHNEGKGFYKSSLNTSDGNDVIWLNYINFKNRKLKSRDGKSIGSYKNEIINDRNFLLSLDKTIEFHNRKKQLYKIKM